MILLEDLSPELYEKYKDLDIKKRKKKFFHMPYNLDKEKFLKFCKDKSPFPYKLIKTSTNSPLIYGEFCIFKLEFKLYAILHFIAYKYYNIRVNIHNNVSSDFVLAYKSFTTNSLPICQFLWVHNPKLIKKDPTLFTYL